MHLQRVGRVHRQSCDFSPERMDDALLKEDQRWGLTVAELITCGYLEPVNQKETLRLALQQANDKITQLEQKLDDEATRLCAAQMLLEEPIEVSAEHASQLYHLKPGDTLTTFKNRTFKRVE